MGKSILYTAPERKIPIDPRPKTERERTLDGVIRVLKGLELSEAGDDGDEWSAGYNCGVRDCMSLVYAFRQGVKI